MASLALCAVACTSARTAPLASEPVAASRYLALGDSFTIGTGSTPAQSYPARLTALASCAVELRNVGVNGYTTEDVIDEELPELGRFAPTFVSLAIGANDIVQGRTRDEYREHVRHILAAARASGAKRVVSLPQPDWSLSPAARAFGEPSAIHARIVDANAILRDETLAAGGTFVDLFPLMETQARAGMLAGDGLHPSTAAYEAWATELARQGVSPCG
ncbi:MAG TPA: SGNH/GDSL hydrolase family protein [Polyangiaceae bacterium]|jgi:lysophospholipase L1-like esterase